MRKILDDIKTRRTMTLVVIIGAVFYFAVDPATFPFMPQCVFHRLTGLQCVGCGSQRMLHALLHGDIAVGFRANAFVTISLPFVAFLLWVELNRERRPHLYRRVYSPVLIIATGVAFAAWMIVRNMLGI